MAVNEVSHPLVKHKLAQLRRADISGQDFRRISNEIATFLMVFATTDMGLQSANVQGWQGTDIGVEILTQADPTLVPILRAGLGMLDGCLSVLPSATVSMVGLYRDEVTLEPLAYFDKVIEHINERSAIIIDPMLATGGSCIATIDLLKAKGCRDIKGLFLVASPEGVQRLQEVYPDVTCWVAGIDQCLNDKGYIIPGLGDAGDKIFGTM